MDYSPFTLATDVRAQVGHLAGLAPPTRDPRAQTRTSPIRLLLAHRPGIFSQGLAVLLAAEPGVTLVAQVADGEAAWDAIRTRAPDLVLLDLALARPSAIELTRRVHAAAIATRCLTLATDPDPSLASQALRAGAAGCLIKDSGFEELMLALRSIDAGETFVSPTIATRLRTLRGGGHDALPLTCREREVVRLIAAGHSSKTIARALGISPLTVDTHRRHLMRKLDLHSAAEVVRYALRNGLLD